MNPLAKSRKKKKSSKRKKRSRNCKIRLEEPEKWPGRAYEVVNTCTGKSVIVENDMDFPSLAESFGWRAPEYDIHNHSDTMDVINQAAEYLDDHIGKRADDPGYFR